MFTIHLLRALFVTECYETADAEYTKLKLASDMAALHVRVLDMTHTLRNMEQPAPPVKKRKGVEAINMWYLPGRPMNGD